MTQNCPPDCPVPGEHRHALPVIPLGAALPDGRTVDDLRAGQEPDPLPSELLADSGIAAWVLRPEDLDRLGVLTTAPRVLTAEGRDPADVEWPTPGAAEEVTAVPATEHHFTAPWRVARPASDPLDPYRTPDGQVGPDTHVTLSYPELRRLIALHLATCASTMPRERGWLYAEARAKAMADGEAPLRLREVME